LRPEHRLRLHTEPLRAHRSSPCHPLLHRRWSALGYLLLLLAHARCGDQHIELRFYIHHEWRRRRLRHSRCRHDREEPR
jgi:hypothetical protein